MLDVKVGGWAYAQSVDRPNDLNWVPATFFTDVPEKYYSQRLAAAGQITITSKVGFSSQVSSHSSHAGPFTSCTV
jgi:hypothetical protein